MSPRETLNAQIIRRLATEFKLLEHIPAFKDNLTIIDLIMEYWHHLPDALRCPASGAILRDPIVVNHSSIDHVLYNENSVTNAIRHNELRSFDIHNFAQLNPITFNIDFTTIDGIADFVSRTDVDSDILFEINKARENKEDFLLPLFKQNKIAPYQEQSMAEVSISVPIMTAVLAYPYIYKMQSNPVIYFWLLQDAYTLIQANFNKMCRTNNFVEKYSLSLPLYLYALVNNSLSKPYLWTPELLFAPLWIGTAWDYTRFSENYNVAIQDFKNGRLREQIKSPVSFAFISMIMLMNIILMIKSRFGNMAIDLLFNLIYIGLQLPNLYVPTRQAANELVAAKACFINPRKFLQERNYKGYTFTALLRILASLSAGFVMLGVQDNPIISLIVACGVFIQGSLLHGIGTSNNRYRLMSRPPVNEDQILVPLSNTRTTPLHIEEVVESESTLRQRNIS